MSHGRVDFANAHALPTDAAASLPSPHRRAAQLALWVQGIREKRSSLWRQGIEFEELAEGARITNRVLTADRIARLDELGFVWSGAFGCPKVSWEGRFREMMNYYEQHGR